MRKINRVIALFMIAILLLAALGGCKRTEEDMNADAGRPVFWPEELPNKEQEQTHQPQPIAAKKLTDGIAIDSGVMVKEPDAAFQKGQMDLSIALLKRTAEKEEGSNVLLSPLSITMALAMAANGAVGRTEAEMLSLLGGHKSGDLNAYLYGWRQNMLAEEQGKLKIANSVWFSDIEGFEVEKPFLQTNVQYYDSEVYSACFDAATVRDINQWVANHTDGMIDHLIDRLSDEARMVLINALAFEAEWQRPYEDYQVSQGEFTAASGQKQNAEFMCSKEYSYLEDDGAIGFLRNYKGGKFSFGALMPEDMKSYLAGFGADQLQTVLQNKKSGDVRTYLPKFKVEYGLLMNELLQELGMETAFGLGADFTKMGNQDLLIDQVLHKTYIEVDTWGTKAAAVTSITMEAGAAPSQDPPIIIRLDRPFIYFILDNETNLPIFIGALNTLK